MKMTQRSAFGDWWITGNSGFKCRTATVEEFRKDVDACRQAHASDDEAAWLGYGEERAAGLKIFDKATKAKPGTKVDGSVVRFFEACPWAKALPINEEAIVAPVDLKIVFTNDDGDFSAWTKCEEFLKKFGFSIGSMERGEPRGVMFGDIDISKWRGLSTAERGQLHGTAVGRRDTDVTLTIVAKTCPKDAFDAVAKNGGAK